MTQKYFLIGIVVLVLCGCGKKIVSISGEVLYEGEPAKDVAVLFEPKSDATQVPHAGLAVTDKAGRFSIQSTEKRAKNGIEPGQYTVFLGWKNPDPVQFSDAGPQPDDPPLPVSPYRFPEKVGNGDVVVTVEGGRKNHFVFNVTPNDIQWE